MNTVEQSHWEVLIDHEDYEICSEYPHQIRKRSNKRARMPMDQRAKIFLSFKALQDDTEESPFNSKKTLKN